ncbi:hypothetical protein [Streptomyces sp. CA-111067]|uniref:hypothetical protein n=1 Tax=Streptomyces sp. CA-111067 TaxID=3240046 RepID=UPI003D95C442
MKTFLRTAVTEVRDAITGRRRLRRYTHPDAHRTAVNRDSSLAGSYRPAPPSNTYGPSGF